MKRIAHQTMLTMALIVCSPLTSLFAFDTVTKKSDGKKVSGTITAMSKNELTLKKTQGDETIPASDIAMIEWEGGGPELKLGYTDENGGRLEQALQRFNKAKADAKSPSDFLKGEYEYSLARVAAKQALADPDKREQAIQKLQAVAKAYPDHIRFYDSTLLLSQIQLAARDFSGARATLEILKKSTSPDVTLAARIADGRILMSEGKTEEAIAAFNAAAAAAGDSPSEAARKYEAMLGQARGLILQTKFDDALKILDVVTDKGPQEDSAVQAEAYTLEGQALQGLGRSKDAALAYLHIDVLYPRELGYHAEALYQLSHLWKVVQHPDRSAEAAGKLVQLYPQSEWRKKLTGNE